MINLKDLLDEYAPAARLWLSPDDELTLVDTFGESWDDDIEFDEFCGQFVNASEYAISDLTEATIEGLVEAIDDPTITDGWV